ncbi:MAG: Asr1405/Asl0597 family protein [Cyanobacteria bacterium P01_A01_bin.135]
MNVTETDALMPLELDPIERWAVFDRLQALSIPCHCAYNQPLRVQVATVTAALQVWSVVQQATQPRLALAERLESCWRQPVQ